MNIHTGIAEPRRRLPQGHARRRSPASGSSRADRRPTSIADEILTDDPGRLRAMIVESSNPAHSIADSPRMREALERLDLLVVIDVALTETARLADYVLPVAVAVREVGGELLLPRVPAQRVPAAPPGAGPAARDRPAARAARSTAGSCAPPARSTASTSTACARPPSARARSSRGALFGLVGEQPELRRAAAR